MKLHEEWLTFSDEERLENTGKYVAAQSSFHFVGNYTIMKSKRRLPVVLPATAQQTEEENGYAQQLQFGDEAAASSAGANATEAPTASMNDLGTTQNNENSAFSTMDVDEISDPKNDMPKLVPATKSEQTNKVDQMDQSPASVVETAGSVSATEAPVEAQSSTTTAQSNMVDPPKELPYHKLSTMPFVQQTLLFKPIFELKMMSEIDENSINNILKAVQSVTKEAEEMRVKIETTTVRTLVQHIITLFDEMAAKCWTIRLMNEEPTFTFLANFLIDYRRLLPEPKTKVNQQKSQDKFTIPKIKPQQNKFKAAARALTPSPVRNPNKRPKRNSICPLCKNTHLLIECEHFRSKTMEDREAFVAKMKLCVNCFSTTHTVAMCLDGSCKICNKKHNSLIHHRPSASV